MSNNINKYPSQTSATSGADKDMLDPEHFDENLTTPNNTHPSTAFRLDDGDDDSANFSPQSSSGSGFFATLASPFYAVGNYVGGTIRNTLGLMTGRPPQEVLEKRHAQALAIREKVNKSLSRRLANHVQSVPKRIFVGTWNVAKTTPPSTAEMVRWFSGNISGGSTGSPTTSSSSSSGSNTLPPLKPEDLPKIAVIGLQEAAMDGKAIVLETTEAIAEWSEACQAALHQLAREAGQPTRYRKLEAVQLVGLIMLIFLPHDEFSNVRHLRSAVARTGPFSVSGNKGAVGCRFTFHGKRLLFICGHFAPHEHNVSQRDHHYFSALDRLDLRVPDTCDDVSDFVLRINPDRSMQDRGANNSGVQGAGWTDRFFVRRELRQLKNATERSRALLHTHDYTFFFGDLNYRLVRSADSFIIKNLMSRGKINQLLQYDELTLGVRKNLIFEGFSEPPVHFLPTYKLVKNSEQYDMKSRKPAWTDRVLVHPLNGDCDFVSRMRSSEMMDASEDSVVFLDVDDSRDAFGGSGSFRRTGSSESIGSANSGGAGGVDNGSFDGVSPGSLLSPSFPPAMPKTSASFDDFLKALDKCQQINATVENHVDGIWYTSVPSMMTSDHRPIGSAFDISVPILSQKDKEMLIFDTKQELGLDFLDEIKYSY